MSEERRTAIIEQRNSLLSRLNACYPGSLRGDQLYRILLALFPDYTKTNCIKDLYYLEEKGYIERRSHVAGRISRETAWGAAYWKLTTRGNEIANEILQDPALEI